MECTVYVHNAIRQPGQSINGLITLQAIDTTLHNNITPVALKTIKIQFLGKCTYDNRYINTNILQQHINEYCNSNKHNTLTQTNIQVQPDGINSFKLLDTRITTLYTTNSTEFTILLPYNIPCTYNGRYVKYMYYIMIALYDIHNYKVTEYKIPIQIQLHHTYNNTVIQSVYNTVILFKHSSINNWPHYTVDATQSIIPNTNINNTTADVPHNTNIESIDTDLHSHNEHTFSSSVVYNISQTLHDNTDIHVVQLTMNKQNYHINDIIYGYLDFSHCNVQCYRLIVTLQQIESIQQTYRYTKSRQHAYSKTLQTFHRYTRNIKTCQIQFALDSDIVPSFHTELISCTYALQFKFIISNQSTDHVKHTANSEKHVDVLEWSLPLTIVSTTHIPHQHDSRTLYVQRSDSM